MTNNLDRAIEVIGEAYQEAMDSGTPSTWRYQIAQALADAGLLAPDLPELSESSEAGVTAFGQVYIRYSVDDLHMTPAEARDLADDLNAAANHAEGVGCADA